jgi:hypothetical protein
MNEPVKACMGGWCQRRASCPNYLTELRSSPAERLCGAEDGKPREPIGESLGTETRVDHRNS